MIEGATLGGRELGRLLGPMPDAPGLAAPEGRRFFLAAGKPEWLSCQDNRNRYWRHPWFTNAA